MERLSEKNGNKTMETLVETMRLTVFICFFLEGSDCPVQKEQCKSSSLQRQLLYNAHLPDKVHMSSALLRRYQSFLSREAA